MTTQRTIPDASALGGWRKSSYSGPSNGDCVEVSDAIALAAWRKSTYSGASNGNCVEVSTAHPAAAIPVRDSKNPTGPALLFPPATWAGFVSTL
jgi:hypothetical protein